MPYLIADLLISIISCLAIKLLENPVWLAKVLSQDITAFIVLVSESVTYGTILRVYSLDSILIL